MKRLAAVVAAAALILAAVLVRRQIDGPSVAEQEQSTPLRLVCERLFETACNAIRGAQVRIEDPMTTATAIASGADIEADAWVTTDLWTSIAASRARSQGRSVGWLENAESLGTTQPVLVGAQPRITALAAACQGSLTWTCVGDRVNQPWQSVGVEGGGSIEIGWPVTDTSAGLATVAAMASAYLGKIDFSANDFDGEGTTSLRDWYERLNRSQGGFATGSTTPLQFLATRGAGYGVVGDLGAAVPTASVVPLTTTVSTPELRLRAVVATPGGRKAPAKELREALDPSWDAPDEPSILPSAGVLDALLAL